MPVERSALTKTRFLRERASGDYPEEVFQVLSYDLFHRYLEVQGLYFMLATSGRTKINLKRQVWESLLAMETNLDPSMLLYLVSLETGFPQGWIMNQFVDPSVGLAFFNENLKAIIDESEFKGRDKYKKYSHLLTAPELFEEAYIREEAPEAFKIVFDPASKKMKDVFSLSEEVQKDFWRAYLYDSNHRIRQKSFFRMIFSLISRITPGEGREMAEYIHSVRNGEFVK